MGKPTFDDVIGWIFGIPFLCGGIFFIAKGSWFGLAFLIPSVFFIPPSRNYIFQQIKEKPSKMICLKCESESDGEDNYKGSVLITIILLICFIVPGIIYGIWRGSTRHKTCPYCKSSEIIPLDTPAGRRITEKLRG